MALGSCVVGLEERSVRYVTPISSSPRADELDTRDLHDLYRRELQLDERGADSELGARDLSECGSYLTTRDLGELDGRDLYDIYPRDTLDFDKRDIETNLHPRDDFGLDERDMENFLYTRDDVELDERDIETDLYARGVLAPRRGIGGLGKALGKAFGKALHKGNGKGKRRKIINNMLSSNSNNGGNGQEMANNLNRGDFLNLYERD